MLVNSMQNCVLVNSMQEMYAGEQYARVASCHTAANFDSGTINGGPFSLDSIPLGYNAT